MKRDTIERSIVELLASKSENASGLPASGIANLLGLKGQKRKRLQSILHTLVSRGDIVRLPSKRYSIGVPEQLVSGVIQATRSGNAFLVPDKGDEGVFIYERDLSTALPGDRVLVRAIPPDDRAGSRSRRGQVGPGPVDRQRPVKTLAPTGKVLKILERSLRHVVGLVQKSGRLTYVAPLAPGYRQDFYIDDARGAKPGDRVILKFVSWGNRHQSPEGEITEVIGPFEDASADTRAVMHQYGLADAFPEPVIREAEAVASLIDAPGEREDLREGLIITIDPERSRDFDDALSLTKAADDRYELGVHIADVSHFVQSGSLLDREARSRGNSTYLPDCVIPMLPEQLSNGVCSLNPGVDRLAFSVFITFDGAGTPLGSRFARTHIRSSARLTYEQAMEVIGGGRLPESLPGGGDRGAIVELLRGLAELAGSLRAARMGRGALDLDMDECAVVLDRKGDVVDIRLEPSDASHQLVEECMVAANEAVAAELSRRRIPVLSRYHEKPRLEKIEELQDYLTSLGYKPGNLTRRKSMAGFLRKIADDPLAPVLRLAVLKSLNRALYSGRERGHYGLAKDHYLHFTSPIRRYPDLIMHRQLGAMLLGEKSPWDREALDKAGLHCTDTEQNSERAERDIKELKKFRFLESERGRQQVFDAAIVNIAPFGLFVEPRVLQLQGLIHTDGIPGGRAFFNRRQQALICGSKSYAVGDEVRVVVEKVDFFSRRVDFALVPEKGKGRPARRQRTGK